MNTRLVVVLTAMLACSATELRGQDGPLTAFGSDRELAEFLRSRQPLIPPRVTPPPTPAPTPAPAPALPSAAVVSQPMPPGTYSGPVEQWPVTVAGRATNAQGQPEAAVLVRIESLDVGASTGADGTYRFEVPRTRFQPGQSVNVTASRTGLSPVSRTLTLQPGGQLTLNFQLASTVLLMEDLVVTGVGLASESITNTQHEGVDEGGIVKLHGDHLVVLRRGRLFTVNVGGGRLEPVDAVNAFAPGAEPAAWYDEMLVSGENVIVIGYGGEEGTEIDLFRIDAGGRLAYRSTHHLRSDDYYSSRNYASRLVNGKLVVYAPVEVGDADHLAEWMPGVRRWQPRVEYDPEDDPEDDPEGDPEDDGFRRTLRPTRIYRPGREVDADDWLTLHTVTTCGMERGDLDCESSAVLGPEGSVFYVSPTAVYVWVTEWTVEPGGRRGSGMVYRLPLDGRDPTALGVEGSPVDQFSFLESSDGYLNVLVRSDGMGDRMWAAEWAEGDVRLLRVALDEFADGRTSAPRRAYRILPRPGTDGEAFANRFVGRHLLYGEGSGWGEPEGEGSTLYVVRWRGGRAAQLPLPHGVDRIEAMGADAVVVGADTADLHFTGIRLAGEPRVAQRYVHRQAAQGETRSHGFFYRQDGTDEGVIGLPIAGPARPGYAQLFEESAAVLFIRNEDRQFRPLGELLAQAESVDDEKDGCVASCVDWYGNARPVFLRGRVFALLGYEIVEGEVTGGRIREVARATFAPPPRDAHAH